MMDQKKWKKTPDWGGSRPGAGMPARKRPNKRRCNFKLAPDVIDLLNEIKAGGTAKSVAIETAVRAMYGPESKAVKSAVSRAQATESIIILSRSSIQYGAPESREGA